MNCADCGQPMAVSPATGLSTHLTGGGSIDYNANADHVAYLTSGLMPVETAWGEAIPEGCLDSNTGRYLPIIEHEGYSDFDGECRDCGYGSGIPTDCVSCQ